MTWVLTNEYHPHEIYQAHTVFHNANPLLVVQCPYLVSTKTPPNKEGNSLPLGGVWRPTHCVEEGSKWPYLVVVGKLMFKIEHSWDWPVHFDFFAFLQSLGYEDDDKRWSRFFWPIFGWFLAGDRWQVAKFNNLRRKHCMDTVLPPLHAEYMTFV